MKKYIFLIIILILTISCGKKSEKTVDIFLKTLMSKNIEESKKYVENFEILNRVNFDNETKMKKLFFDKLFQNFEYEILNVTSREDGNDVVNVKIKNIDMEEILDITFKKIFRKTLLGESDIKIENEFKEILENSNLPIKENISQFLITKNKKILLRNENIKYIFGGYF